MQRLQIVQNNEIKTTTKTISSELLYILSKWFNSKTTFKSFTMITAAIHRNNEAIEKSIHQNLSFECKCQVKNQRCFLCPSCLSCLSCSSLSPVFPGFFFLSRPSSNYLKQFFIKKKRKSADASLSLRNTSGSAERKRAPSCQALRLRARFVNLCFLNRLLSM